MALCHDERDFAMGFTRHDPHGSRYEITASERRRAEERLQYLNSLKPEEKLAHERVEFCLAAVGQYFVAVGEMTPVHLSELHEHFPNFAKNMGFEGPLYAVESGRCPAIDISFPEREDTIWFLIPYFNFERLEEEAKKEAQKPEARAAALAFCKSWLPNWKWDEVKLP